MFFAHQLHSIKGHGISIKGADFVDVGTFSCQRSLQAVARATAGYRVALMLVYQNVVRNAGGWW